MSTPTQSMRPRICLWFEKDGLAAAETYCRLIPDSRIENTVPGPAGQAFIVEFNLGGVPMMILNGGPHYTLSPAASIAILTDTQDALDTLWDALLADGGSPMQCGWLTDRWGVSWQIAPRRLPEMSASPDRQAAARVQAAMMQMVKLDLAALERAFAGE